MVRHIFDLYINGKGYKAIANQLNKEGYKTKKGSAFGISTVNQIVTNPVYAGFIRFNQVQNWSEKRRKGKREDFILVRGEHEPIIEMEIWQKAQAVHKDKSHKPTKTFYGHFPLTTLLRCPSCGHGMIGHKSKNSNGEYLRYYQCGNFRSKGSTVCSSNLVWADYAEDYVFKKLEQITAEPTLLKVIVGRVNNKVASLKQPIQEQMQYVSEQLANVERNIKRYLNVIEKTDSPPASILDKITELETEKKALLEQNSQLKYEFDKPTIKEISFEMVYTILKQFSKFAKKVDPEKQKELLHSIINKITVNTGNRPEKRSVKEIELFFDASIKADFVFTCDTVRPAGSEMPGKPARAELPAPSDAGR